MSWPRHFDEFLQARRGEEDVDRLQEATGRTHRKIKHTHRDSGAISLATPRSVQPVIKINRGGCMGHLEVSPVPPHIDRLALVNICAHTEV